MNKRILYYPPLEILLRCYRGIAIAIKLMAPIQKTCCVCSVNIEAPITRVSFCLICANAVCNKCIAVSNSNPVDSEFASEELICLHCYQKPSRKASQLMYEHPDAMSATLMSNLFIDISKCYNPHQPAKPTRLLDNGYHQE